MNEGISYKEIERQVKEVIAKELGIKIDNVDSDKKLKEDLGMDSFASVELIFELEQKMGIEIADEELKDIRIVGDVVNYIFKRIDKLK